MKKRFITVILAAAMCLSLAACDKKSDSTDQSSVISQEEVSSTVNSDVVADTSSTEDVTSTIELNHYKQASDGVYDLTKEQALEFAKRVQLTNDNWQEYFDNRTTTNTEEGETARYFGVADNYDIVMYNDVRFEAKTQINYYDDGMCAEYQYRDGAQYYASYKEGTEPTNWEKVDRSTETAFPIMATLKEDFCFSRTTNLHYNDIQSASGEVVLMDIPDLLWRKYNENDTTEYISIEGYRLVRYVDNTDANEEVYNLLFN